MMDKKKLLLLGILLFFVAGLCVNSVSATHTVKVGKYNVKLTDGQYNDLKHQQDTNTVGKSYRIKTGKYYTYKKPKYTYKKVKKTKWVYKNVLTGYDMWASDFSWSKTDSYDNKKYWNSKKWKYCGSHSVSIRDNYVKHYATFKKKVTYTAKKKVKTRGYTKAKEPIYCDIFYSSGGMADKGIIALVYSNHYFEKYDKYMADKLLRF